MTDEQYADFHPREGWARIAAALGARREHYFRPAGPSGELLSLCRGWSLGRRLIDWSLDQVRGYEPPAIGGRRCKACWRQAPEVAP